MESALTSQNVLLLLAELVGAALLLGVIWLLRDGRIYLDRSTEKPIEFEFPLLGKLKTQNPVIAVILVGAGLVAYPISVSRGDQATIEGYIETDGKPVTITVIPLPKFQATVQGSGPFKLPVPVIPEVNYRAWYSVDKHIAQDNPFDLDRRGTKLTPFKYTEAPVALPIAATKEVPDEKLKGLGID
jgi:hypothetical protein